jgi:hypothetical protein
MKILPFIQSEDALSPRFNQSISRSQSAAVLSDVAASVRRREQKLLLRESHASGGGGRSGIRRGERIFFDIYNGCAR